MFAATCTPKAANSRESAMVLFSPLALGPSEANRLWGQILIILVACVLHLLVVARFRVRGSEGDFAAEVMGKTEPPRPSSAVPEPVGAAEDSVGGGTASWHPLLPTDDNQSTTRPQDLPNAQSSEAAQAGTQIAPVSEAAPTAGPGAPISEGNSLRSLHPDGAPNLNSTTELLVTDVAEVPSSSSTSKNGVKDVPEVARQEQGDEGQVKPSLDDAEAGQTPVASTRLWYLARSRFPNVMLMRVLFATTTGLWFQIVRVLSRGNQASDWVAVSFGMVLLIGISGLVLFSSWRMKRLLGSRANVANLSAAPAAELVEVDESPQKPAVEAVEDGVAVDRVGPEKTERSDVDRVVVAESWGTPDGFHPYREYGPALPQSWPEVLRRTLLPQGFWSPNNAYASLEVAEHCALFEVNFSTYIPSNSGMVMTPLTFLRTAVVSVLTALPITGSACGPVFYIVAVVHLCFGIGLLVARPFRRPWEVVPASVCCFVNGLLALNIAGSLDLRSDAILNAVVWMSLVTLILNLVTFGVEAKYLRPRLAALSQAKHSSSANVDPDIAGDTALSEAPTASGGPSVLSKLPAVAQHHHGETGFDLASSVLA
jgi:hypothetical protein